MLMYVYINNLVNLVIEKISWSWNCSERTCNSVKAFLQYIFITAHDILMADDVKNVEDAKQLQNANTEEIQRGEAWNVQHIE